MAEEFSANFSSLERSKRQGPHEGNKILNWVDELTIPLFIS